MSATYYPAPTKITTTVTPGVPKPLPNGTHMVVSHPLAFTGVDTVLLVLVAVVLISAGLFVLRLSRIKTRARRRFLIDRSEGV